MKIPNSVESNFTNHKEESSYKFFDSTDQIKPKCSSRGGNILKFDNLLTKRSILFDFMGDSHLSDHIIKLDFYAKDDHEILSREDILEYRNRMMDKCEVYRNECRKFEGTNKACWCSQDPYSSDNIEHAQTCKYFTINNNKEIKIINLLKEYIIDLKYLFAKMSLEEKEVEIFDKIILWMYGLFIKLSEEDRETIFNRLGNEFYDLDYSYIVVINFLKSYFRSKTSAL